MISYDATSGAPANVAGALLAAGQPVTGTGWEPDAIPAVVGALGGSPEASSWFRLTCKERS